MSDMCVCVDTSHVRAVVQTKSKLYLILDFINGGHLFFQLYRQGTFRWASPSPFECHLVIARNTSMIMEIGCTKMEVLGSVVGLIASL